MKKFLLATTLLLSTVMGAQAQNVTFRGNVIDGFWYQKNDNREWTTYLIGVYTFTDQKQSWTYEIDRSYDSETMMTTYTSSNIEVTNPAIYGSQGAIRVEDYFYTFFGREKQSDDDPANLDTEYGQEETEVVVRKWDINTWELLETNIYPTSRNLNFSDLTYDPNDDVVYCIYSDLSDSENSAFSTYYLGTLDVNTMTVTRISQKAMAAEFRALAANPDGKLYGIAYGGRTAAQTTSFPASLYTIDKKTGEYTLVGDIGHGIPRTKMQSLVSDWRTGKLYFAGNMFNSDVEKSTSSQSTKDTGLYEIDITSGKSTLLSKFPYKESVVGMWIEGDYEKKTHDLSVSVTTPRQLTVGESASVIASVKNMGTTITNNYTVTLTANGKTVDTKAGENIEPGEVLAFTFDYLPTAIDGTSVEFQATVDFAADQNTDNNKSDVVAVNLIQSTLPSVDLASVFDGNGVTLFWDLAEQTSITEDFERYTPFIVNNMGDWTIKQNGQKQATVTLRDFEGSYVYPNAGRPFAYQVFNPAEAGVHADNYASDTCTFACNSGNQMLISCVGAIPSTNSQGYEYVVSNDWLISPALSGNAQKISFYAKCWTSQVKDQFGSYQHSTEYFNVLYSLTDTDPESFIQIGATNEAAMWFSDGYHEFQLPEGTKYFAIQCLSDGEGTLPEGITEDDYDYGRFKTGEGFIFFLDDITYVPAAGHLIGYNVYKNGVKMNDELLPVTIEEYRDDDAQGEQNNVYSVTAVYEEGESVPSNAITIIGTGITSVTTSSANHLEGVFTTSGQYIGRKVPQTRGMYIIHRDGQTHKVLVK